MIELNAGLSLETIANQRSILILVLLRLSSWRASLETIANQHSILILGLVLFSWWVVL